MLMKKEFYILVSVEEGIPTKWRIGTIPQLVDFLNQGFDVGGEPFYPELDNNISDFTDLEDELYKKVNFGYFRVDAIPADKHFYNIETGDYYSLEELKEDYLTGCTEAQTFDDYIKNCLEPNGFLEVMEWI